MAETSRRGLLVAIGGAIIALVHYNDDGKLATVVPDDGAGFGVEFGRSFGGA